MHLRLVKNDRKGSGMRSVSVLAEFGVRKRWGFCHLKKYGQNLNLCIKNVWMVVGAEHLGAGFFDRK